MNEVPLHLRGHEFDAPGVVYAQPGQTLLQMLRDAAGGAEISADIVVRVGGYQVPREAWARLRPKAGVRVDVLRQGLAKGGARQILAAVAMIVVAYFAPGWGAALAKGAGWSAAAGNAIASGITLAASLAVNALVSVPMAASGGSETQKAWNALTGNSNQINPYGVIPLVLGEHRLFPPHAAMPYTDVVGYTAYQCCMFELGFGVITVSDMRIGDTPVESFNAFWWELNWPGSAPAKLYTNDIDEQAVNATMNSEGDQVTRTTAPGVDAISLDLLFSNGLKVFGDSLDKGWPMWVLWRVEYRAVGTTAWLPPPTPRLSKLVSSWTPGASEYPTTAPGPGLFLTWDQVRDPFASGIAWDVASGQYEVRVTRVARKNQTNRTWADGAIWTSFRSIRYTNPSTTGTLKLNVRVKGTDQLSGTLQSFSLLAQPHIPVYRRSSNSWANQMSRNPAWVAYWLMTQSPALAEHVPASRIDLNSFADFAAFCDANELECRMVVDAQLTARDLLSKVLGTALGDIGNRDGRYCVVFDRNVSEATAELSPLDIKEFSASRQFIKVPHALRVQFKNPQADWQDDEIIVVQDGYSYRGRDARGQASTDPAATLFETFQLEQAMLPQQAWRLARYHLAQGLYRSTVYSFTTDISGLGIVRGDVVDVAHDVAEWGTGWGRVVSLTTGTPDGAEGATLKLDTEIYSDPTKLYGIQTRTASGGKRTVNCRPHSAFTDTFYLDSRPAGTAAGDRVVLGERGVEMTTLIITGVRYSEDLSSSFTAVAYDARVDPYWKNPPAEIISEVSGRNYGLPAPPQVTVAVSSPVNDEVDDAGIPTAVVRIGTAPRHGYATVTEAL